MRDQFPLRSVEPEAPAADARSVVRRFREAADDGAYHDRYEFLARAPLFAGLTDDDLRGLARKLTRLSYSRGEVVFRENQPADCLFLIGAGCVKLTVSSVRGDELLVAMLGTGEMFGELAVIDRGPRAMTARAMDDDSVLYRLSSDVFWTLLEERPAMSRRLLELMARRLRRADQQSQDLVFFDAPTRLARKLLELAENHGVPAGGGDQLCITVRMTQEELAQMIGVNRSSANRLIASFSSRGWLDWNEGCPLLIDIAQLARRAR